jgi:hypothetical protein
MRGSDHPREPVLSASFRLSRRIFFKALSHIAQDCDDSNQFPRCILQGAIVNSIEIVVPSLRTAGTDSRSPSP